MPQEGFVLDGGTLVIALALATLLIVLAIGIYQRARVSRAKAENEHSALSEDPRLRNDHPAAVEARRRS
jgi:hypothetical protein